jgi:GT2 family glycosyltransferase
LPGIATPSDTVRVVVPFAGDARAGRELLERLGDVHLRDGDELVAVDNSPAPVLEDAPSIGVRRADAEASSYYARNIGAEGATTDWLLFIDADTRPRADLVQRHVAGAAGSSAGALAGRIADPGGRGNIVSRYIATRGWFDQRYAAAQGRWSFGRTANLLVRRDAFEAIGGFCEGIRSTGDTELCWRLAQAGWSIGYTDAAVVVHDHRTTLRGLIRLSARYAAGAAWIRRRHGEPGYVAESDATTAVKGLRNAVLAVARLDADGVRFRALDGLLMAVRAVALRLPNASAPPATPPAHRVVCAGRFPDSDASAGDGARIEAEGRPLARQHPELARGLGVGYREDDAAIPSVRAALELARRRPLRVARWLRAHDLRGLVAVAAPARRTLAAGAGRVEAVGPDERPLAAAIAALTGAALAD